MSSNDSRVKSKTRKVIDALKRDQSRRCNAAEGHSEPSLLSGSHTPNNPLDESDSLVSNTTSTVLTPTSSITSISRFLDDETSLFHAAGTVWRGKQRSEKDQKLLEGLLVLAPDRMNELSEVVESMSSGEFVKK
ncbi:hypothetical protein MHU86_25801 [Fragilaria crotonensis]|nr:hypothetical protein MHU86_25801 [Fragilaria crotonensis]